MKRECIGHVFVDHGGVAIVDPQFVDLSDEDRENLVGDGFGVRLDCGEEGLEPIGGHVGVFVSSGLGDGRYPVIAEIVEVPGAGERVSRIIIDCLGVEDESGDLRERLTAATDMMRERGGFNVRLPYDRDPRVDDDVRRRALEEEL